jgi:long-chain acyl-CoA synthetase
MTSSNERNIFSTFAETARRRSDHTAVVYLGNRYSYEKVADLAGRFAAALADIGIERGRKVMM